MLKGRFTEIRLDVTKKTADFENEKLGVTYLMDEGDDIFKAIEHCKSVVGSTVAKSVVSSTKVVESVKKDQKVSTPKVEVEENQKSNEGEVSKTEEKAPEVKEEKAPKEKKEKAKKADYVLYDRKNDVHKARLGAFLDATVPNWKSGTIIKKASEISAKFTGTEPFLDANGDVLESFKNKFVTLLNE